MANGNRLISIFENSPDFVKWQADITDNDPRRKAALLEAHAAMLRGASADEATKVFYARLNH